MSDIVEMLKKEWRKLGFYYDFDERITVNQWRFYGSKKGLLNLVSELRDIVSDSELDSISADWHYGPYSDLKIIILDKPSITSKYFSGRFKDLEKLIDLLNKKIEASEPGDTFSIDKEYGVDNTVTVKFFVMIDDFDPVSMDELIISNRQEVANKFWGVP